MRGSEEPPPPSASRYPPERQRTIPNGSGVEVQDATESGAKPNLRMLIVVLGVCALVVGVVGVALLRAIGIETALAWVMAMWERLQTAPPIVFFGAMALLTLFPIPLTPFYIAAGSLYGVVPSLLWIPPAILLNNLIAHAMTTSFLRPWLESIVTARGHAIPTLRTKRDQNLFIAMVRITPGIPYFLQSLVLGLAGTDRLRFLVISLPVHMVYVVGFVVLGRSAFDGDFGFAVGAVALLVFVSFCARIAHQRLRRAADSEEL